MVIMAKFVLRQPCRACGSGGECALDITPISPLVGITKKTAKRESADKGCEGMSEDNKKATVIKPGSAPEEILAAVSEDGIELSDEQLEQVTGGAKWLDPDPTVICGYCHKKFSVKEGTLTVECPGCHQILHLKW